MGLKVHHDGFKLANFLACGLWLPPKDKRLNVNLLVPIGRDLKLCEATSSNSKVNISPTE